MREAIRLLANEGLISYTPSRRPYVADPSLDEINECLRVQGSLEALAGEWACKLATDEDIDEIATINAQISQMREEKGPLEAFRLDMKFHEAIVAASKNSTLAETHLKLNARLWRVRFLSSQRNKSRAVTRQEHQNIVDALKSRDPDATSLALKDHLRTAEINIAAAIKEKKQTTKEEQ
jgi:DNA-binding GntR family transcriptional regulator